MANVTISGVDTLVAALEKADLFSQETQEEMLFAAGDILVECIQQEMQRSNFNIASLERNIYYTRKIKKNKYGEPYISVSVKGKNANGQRNATIAFVLNYGRSEDYGEISGGYFWTKGSKTAEPLIFKKIEEIAERRLREGGLL